MIGADLRPRIMFAWSWADRGIWRIDSIDDPRDRAHFCVSLGPIWFAVRIPRGGVA